MVRVVIKLPNERLIGEMTEAEFKKTEGHYDSDMFVTFLNAGVETRLNLRYIISVARIGNTPGGNQNG